MSLANYAALQASALNWLARSSDPYLTAVVPDAIALFETEVVTQLRTSDMEMSATFTVAPTVQIPANLIEVRFMNLTGSYTKPIDYVTPQVMAADYGYGSSWWDTPVFTIDNGNFIFPQIDPYDVGDYPSNENTAYISYYGFTGLAASINGVNWLLTKYPKAYLYGTLAELCAFSEDMRQDGRAQNFVAMRDEIIGKIIASDNRAKHPGILQMRPRGATP